MTERCCGNCGWSEIVGSPTVCNFNWHRTWHDECCEAWKPKVKEMNQCDICEYKNQVLREKECEDCKRGHGYWVVLKNCSNAGVYCSECNVKLFDHYPMREKVSLYCGHCGAKMDRENPRQY